MAKDGNTDGASINNDAGNDSDSILWGYLDVLRRRFWIILPIVVITTTIGLINAFKSPRFYQASAKLLTERSLPSLMNFQDEIQGNRGWDPEFYSTQTELLTSRAVMEVALEDPAMRELFAPGETTADEVKTSLRSEIKRTVLAVLGGTPPPPPAPWETLRAYIVASHVPETHFLLVRARHGNPYRAAAIANATAKAFIEYHSRRQAGQLGESFGMLQKEKEKQEAELNKSEKILQEFRETAQSVSVRSTEQQQPAVKRLTTINEQLTSVQMERIELNSQIGVMQKVITTGEHIAQEVDARLYSVPAIQDDATLGEARRELAEAESELTVLQETYGTEHPVLQAAQTNLYLLRDSFRRSLEEILSSHENRLQMLNAEELELQRQYDEQRVVALDLAKEDFELTRLQTNVDRHRRLLDSIMERMREVEVSSGLAKTSVHLVEPATVPSMPVGTNTRRAIILSILMGLVLGGGLAFLFEHLDDTIKTPEDLKEHVDFSLLGFVPSIEEEPTETGEEEPGPKAIDPSTRSVFQPILENITDQLRVVFGQMIPSLQREEPEAPLEDRQRRGMIVLNEPISSIAEAYRGIRANLFYSNPDQKLRLVAITSCRPKEGKTTVATNLALSIAQTGKRVLLIDGDLHRPSVHRTLGIDSHTGLTNVLVGEASWQGTVCKVSRDGVAVDTLHVLPAGPPSPSPSELLGSQKMKDILREMREAYDWIFIDTPPVLFVSDASILSVICDGVVFVVRAGSSTRTLLARAFERLTDVRAHVVGCVLNRAVVSRIGRYYSTYYNIGYSRYARDYHRSYYRVDVEDPGAAEAVLSLPADEPASRPTTDVLEEDARRTMQAAAKQAAAEPEKRIPHEDLERHIAELARQSSAGNTAEGTLEQQLQQICRHAANASAAEDLMRTELQRERSRREERKAQFAAREKELRQQIREVEHAGQQKLGELTDALENAQKQIAALTAEKEAASNREQEQARRLTELQNKLDRFSAEQNAGMKKTAEASRSLTDRTKDLESAVSEKDRAMDELRKSTDQIRLASAQELQHAKAEADKSHKQVRDAQAALEEARKAAAGQEESLLQKIRDLEEAGTLPENLTPADLTRPGPYRAALERARSTIGAGRFAGARKILSSLIEAQPARVEAWELLLRLCWRQKDSAGLRVLAEQSDSTPGTPEHLRSLALAYEALILKRGDTARQQIELAAMIATHSPAIAEARTVFALEQNDLDGAARYARQLLRMRRGVAYAHHVLGSICYIKGQLRKAERHLRESVKLQITPDALADLAWLLGEVDNLHEAEKAARQAIAIDDTLHHLWNALGTILSKAGRKEEAETAFLKAMELNPEDMLPLVNLAELTIEAGEKESAKELLARLEKKSKEMPAAERSRIKELREKLQKG